jgi:hypothetical protein
MEIGDNAVRKEKITRKATTYWESNLASAKEKCFKAKDEGAIDSNTSTVYSKKQNYKIRVQRIRHEGFLNEKI